MITSGSAVNWWSLGNNQFVVSRRIPRCPAAAPPLVMLSRRWRVPARVFDVPVRLVHDAAVSRGSLVSTFSVRQVCARYMYMRADRERDCHGYTVFE